MANQLNVSDITIDKLTIDASLGEYDLTTHLEELNLYEDIFSNTITGHLTLQEGFNLPQYLPIVGEETVNCNIKMVGVESSANNLFDIINPPPLQVYDLSDRFFKTPKSQRYSLDLVSQQHMSNLHTRISKSYDGGKYSSPSDIVEDIWSSCLDDGRDLFVEQTQHTDQLIIPNWHPHDAFNWLAQRSQPADSMATNYRYFESMVGSHFTSLEKLARAEPVLTFTTEARVDDATRIEGLSDHIVKVDNLFFMNKFQKIKNIKNGQYSSKLITHDIVTKKILQHDYDGFTNWNEIHHLAKNPPISNSPTNFASGNYPRTSLAPPLNPQTAITEGRRLGHYTDSRVEFYPKHDKMYSLNAGHEYDNKVETWKQRRAHHTQIYDNITMQVHCSGISFLRLGMVVTLQVPSGETTSGGKKELAFDRHLSGNYMVTAIRHIFSQQALGNTGYKMMVELTSDGTALPIPMRELKL